MTALLGLPDHLAQLEALDLSDQLVILDRLDQLVLKDHREILDLKATPDLLVQLVLLDRLDQLDLKELRVNLADFAMSLTQRRLELELVLVFCV
jgi:hypothetical protein